MKKHLLLFVLLLLVSASMYAQVSYVISPEPAIDVDTHSLEGFSYVFGNGPSVEKSFTISGRDLVEAITVDGDTAPDYEISLTSGTAFHAESPLILNPDGGNLDTTIYVRLKAGLEVGFYNNENITINNDIEVTCSGTVTALPEPELSVSTDHLDDFTYQVGNGPSDSQFFTISGNNLTDNVVVTPPEDFVVCLSAEGIYSNRLIVDPVEGTIDTNVYVRMKAGLEAGDYNGNLTVACGELNETVALSGTVTNTYTITVLANPTDGGTVWVGNGGINGTYPQGSDCTVHAEPAMGYKFINWTNLNNEQLSSNVNYTFLVIESLTLVANFSSKDYIISVEIVPEEGGTVTGPGGYNYNDSCTLKATPKYGYDFKNWTLDGIVKSDSTTYCFSVDDNANYVAHFEKKSYLITAIPNPIDGGTVTGNGMYAYGATCKLTATSNSDYTFTNWKKGDVIESTDPEFSFEVREDASYSATFTHVQQYTITVKTNPENGGTVSGGGQYYPGVNCTLHANPANGYQFDNWKKNGVVVSSESSFSFEVTADATYTAYFSEIPVTYYTITISVEPEGAGTATESSQYPEGSSVTLTATANNGYSFTGWMENGNLVSSEPNCTITATSNRTMVAIFSPIIKEPDPICSGESLTLENPLIGGEWQLSSDFDFENFIPYDNQPLDASYNGWYLRYHYQWYSFEWDSNIVQITVNSLAEFTLEGDESVERNQEVKYWIVIEGETDYSNYSFIWSVSDEQAVTTITEDSCKVIWKTANEQQISVIVTDNRIGCSDTLTKPVTVSACIDDLQTIQPKEHTEGHDTYVLILVYPNPNDVAYEYQWRYSADGEIYNDLKDGTCNKQYYYKGDRIKEGYYKVRVSNDRCSEETEPYHVDGSRLRIYPNPSYRDSNIVVEKGCDGQARLNIFSTDGRLLHTQTLTDDQATIGISLPQGVYVAYLTDSEGYTKVCKLIIQ